MNNDIKNKKKKPKRRFNFKRARNRFINLLLALLEGAVIFRCLVYLRERGETLPFVTTPIPDDKTLLIIVGALTFFGFIAMRVWRKKIEDIDEWLDKTNSRVSVLAGLIAYLFLLANMFLLIFLPPYFYVLTCSFESRYTNLYGTVAEVGETKAIEGVIPFIEADEYTFYTIDYEYEGKAYTTFTSSKRDLKKGEEVMVTLNHFCPEKCSIANSITLTQGNSKAEKAVMLFLLIAPVMVWRFFFTGNPLYNTTNEIDFDDD